MKGVSKNIIIAAALLVLIAIGGGFGWYWTASEITRLQVDQNEVSSKIGSLERRVYSPKNDHLKTLQQNDQVLLTLLDGFKDELQTRDAQFAAIRVVKEGGAQQGLEPDEWKKKFSNIREQLTKDAAQARVAIPADYDFSFSAYRLTLPLAGVTLPLGIQLLGVEKITQILINAKVRYIEWVKRADVEPRGSGGGGRDSSGDLCTASVLEGADNLYKVYPFAVSFVCLPETLIEIVNQLENANLLMVIRNIGVENEKQIIRQASQVKVSPSGDGAPASTDEGKAEKLVIPELGQENINVRLYVDLLYLTLDNAGAAKKPAREKKP
ncbi:MAG: Amuc_1100 family pilus-like protein [Verrucomicrobiales bacterium]|jgi:hypothetical protein|nr:Amuc_1100 family pilus-like protein [Verrucomicrobiales bacterium]